MITQMELVSGVVGILADHDHKTLAQRQLNTIIEACNSIMASLDKPFAGASAGMGLSAWLQSDDTGMSSLWMAHVLCGTPIMSPNSRKAYPHDPSDFGRCIRFLEAVPEARGRLAKMRDSGPKWARYIDRWDEMESLYREELPSGKAPRLYALMMSLQDDAAKEAP